MFAKLVLTAAEVRWRVTRHSPWWLAADLFVEIAKSALCDVPDGGRLRDACEIVDLQIGMLRDQPDDVELAATLEAAGRLVFEPYRSNFQRNDPGGSIDRWLSVEDWQALTRSGDEEVGPVRKMPEPAEAARRALRYFDEGTRVGWGHLRGLCLAGRMTTMTVMHDINPEAPEWSAELSMQAAQEAYRLVNKVESPTTWQEILWLLTKVGIVATPKSAKDLLPVSLDQLGGAYGERTAFSVLLLAVQMTGSRELRRTLWREIERLLGDTPDMADRRLVWDVAVHASPDDIFGCPYRGAAASADSRALQQVGLRSAWRQRRVATSWRRQLAVAAAHRAAHALPGTESQAILALDRLRDVDPGFADQQAGPLNYLAVRLLLQQAATLEQGGDAIGARTSCIMAADRLEQLARAEGNHRLAAADLGIDMMDRVMRYVSPDDATDEGRVRRALQTLAVAQEVLPGLGASIYEHRARLVQLFGQLLGAIIAAPACPASLLLSHHLLCKGVDFGLLLGTPGPHVFTELIESRIQKIRTLETASGPYVPPPLDELVGDENDGLLTLCYANTAEANPDPGGSSEEVTNLRRSVDTALTRQMLGAASNSRSLIYTGPGRQDDLSTAIPPDTVLLSVYLGMEFDATQTNRRCPLLSVELVKGEFAEDSVHAYRSYLGVPGDLYTLVKDGRAITFHSAAILIAKLREVINVDPLHMPVTAHAEWLLSGQLYLGGALQQLTKWREAGKTHLCIWANGPLHYVPFHLLHMNGRPLADDWTVTNLPSSALLSRPPIARRVPERLVSVGAAGFGAVRFGLTPEPALEGHARDVAQSNGSVLIGADASPQRVLAVAEQATYLHVAAHGSHDETAAWFQCLYLNADDGGDGRLFAHDILRLDLRGLDLVTLSSCESAMGRFDQNDNLRGLPAAFLLAGAATVIGCLWPVSAQVATLFFRELYGFLRQGQSKLSAFRGAQLTTRRRFPAYRDWGAFTFTGDWR